MCAGRAGRSCSTSTTRAGQLRQLPHTLACPKTEHAEGLKWRVGQRGFRNGWPGLPQRSSCSFGREAHRRRRPPGTIGCDRSRPPSPVDGPFRPHCRVNVPSRWTHRPGASGAPRGPLPEGWRSDGGVSVRMYRRTAIRPVGQRDRGGHGKHPAASGRYRARPTTTFRGVSGRRQGAGGAGESDSGGHSRGGGV